MIPAPVGGTICGGWTNGSFVLFFAIATCVFWRLDAPEPPQAEAGRRARRSIPENNP
jgi:hypothetical protein